MLDLLSNGMGELEPSLEGTEPSLPRSSFGEDDFINREPPDFEVDLVEAQSSDISTGLTIL